MCSSFMSNEDAKISLRYYFVRIQTRSLLRTALVTLILLQSTLSRLLPRTAFLELDSRARLSSATLVHRDSSSKSVTSLAMTRGSVWRVNVTKMSIYCACLKSFNTLTSSIGRQTGRALGLQRATPQQFPTVNFLVTSPGLTCSNAGQKITDKTKIKISRKLHSQRL